MFDDLSLSGDEQFNDNSSYGTPEFTSPVPTFEPKVSGHELHRSLDGGLN